MANQKPTTSLEYENVNGIKLVLNVHKRQTPPDARIFTITYKNVKSNNSKIGAKASLFLAIIFNLLALFYIRISLTAILIIIIVLSFLVFFWFTHSVQSGLMVCFVVFQNRVLYYLTLLKKEDNPDSVRLVPLFKYTKPRLVMLQKIYSEIQTFLMDAQKESSMASGDKK
ncbi:hypothetical protein HF086_003445 [Spodoptera exigua]|uniref:Uncharacterized protein n=1 Tax=Spodoptera exigua TaxID=7107 RepID=A0A922MGR0_SPOEX|nr:hypothetical protein HF086_003445 [Spodoptera exigua]